MEKIMADNLAALAARDEKRRLEKKGRKEVIEVQKADVDAKLLEAEARRMDVEAKIRAEDTRIMLADLSSVDDGTRVWFMKRRAEIRARDAAPCAQHLDLLLDFFNCCSCLVVPLLDSTLRRTICKV
jgi:hypothetical protein